MSLIRKFILILLLFSALRQNSNAQTEDVIIDSLTPKKPVVFRDKKSGEARIRIFSLSTQVKSNGWNIGLSLAKSMPDFTSRRMYHYFYVGIGNIRHPKEFSQTTLLSGGVGSAVPIVKYGKANTLYPIEFSYGRRKIIGRKAVYDGVEVSWEYRAGILAAAIVPYPVSTIFGDVTEYNSNTAIFYQDLNSITGSNGSLSNFSFDNMAYGLRAQSNIAFSYNVRKRLVATVLLGASIEFYSKSIPLFWTGDSGPVFADIHAGIEIGKMVKK